MLLFTKVETPFSWIKNLSDTPFLGKWFLFILIFVPAVICSFIAKSTIPGLDNELGFTKAMLVLLPLSNLIMWISKIRLYLLFIPSWILLGAIAIIKTILFLKDGTTL